MEVQKGRQWSGQVTIFALLVFMVVASVLASQYRSALFYACSADAKIAANLSADAFLATYQRALRDCYGILAVDAGYGQETFQQEQIEQKLLQVFQNNMKSSMISGQVESIALAGSPIYTWLIDGDWEFFVREMTLNSQEKLIDQGVAWIAEQWKSKNRLAENTLNEKKRIADQKGNEYDEDLNDSTETYMVSDPRDRMMSIWNQGILSAACPSGYVISEKAIQMTDVSYPETEDRLDAEIDFKNEDSLLTLFRQWENILKPDQIVDDLTENLAVQSYIRTYFQNACSDSGKQQSKVPHVFDYETEYLIGGHGSDGENLKTVLWKLLAMRCVFNLSYLMTSSEKSQQVLVTAAALSSALLIPHFTEVTAFVLKMMWAFGEALTDCRTILRGGCIPIMKDDDSWYLNWNAMFSLDEGILDGNPGYDGLDYDTYLQILLTLMNNDTMYRRVTHLMEKNIRQIPEYEGFWMKNCIYGIQVNYICKFKRFGSCEFQSALSY